MSNSNNAQSRSLWIGDIEYWMDEVFIIKIFDAYANVKNIKIIRDKSKTQNLGYGFIEFENQEIAKEILNQMNGKLIPETNKTLKLNWASYSAGKQAAMSNVPITDHTIYVGDLEASVTEEKLKEYFSKFYSSILSAKIIIDPVNKISKGYGFVKFTDQSEAQKALLEMNGKILNGKSIKTNQAAFKKINSDSNLLTNQLHPQYSNNYYNTYYPEQGNNGLFSISLGLNYNSTGNNISNINKFQQNCSNVVNTNSINNTNLNNFYTQNPNNLKNNFIDTGNEYLTDGNYNLNNFYYNNMNNIYFQNMYNPLYGVGYGQTINNINNNGNNIILPNDSTNVVTQNKDIYNNSTYYDNYNSQNYKQLFFNY